MVVECRSEPGTRDNNVIDQGEPEGGAVVLDAFAGDSVLAAWCRVTTWVIVRKGESMCIETQ